MDDRISSAVDGPRSDILLVGARTDDWTGSTVDRRRSDLLAVDDDIGI